MHAFCFLHRWLILAGAAGLVDWVGLGYGGFLVAAFLTGVAYCVLTHSRRYASGRG